MKHIKAGQKPYGVADSRQQADQRIQAEAYVRSRNDKFGIEQDRDPLDAREPASLSRMIVMVFGAAMETSISEHVNMNLFLFQVLPLRGRAH